MYKFGLSMKCEFIEYKKNSIHTHESSCISRKLLFSYAFMLLTGLNNEMMLHILKLKYFMDAINKLLNKDLTKM